MERRRNQTLLSTQDVVGTWNEKKTINKQWSEMADFNIFKNF